MIHSTKPNRARLAMSTGEIFEGWGFGAQSGSTGEIVFNTAMSGYEESLSDPSYKGQILVQTAAMIGNTGMNDRDMESRKIQISGLVVQEHVDAYSNYRASKSLHDTLLAAGVPGICGVDTRAITTLLRSQGVVQGVLCRDSSLSDAELVAQARSLKGMAGSIFQPDESSNGTDIWEHSSGLWDHLHGEVDGEDLGTRFPIGLIDCGVKENILRCLVDVGCSPKQLPMDISASKMKQMLLTGEIGGVFLSNGPGDPSAMTGLIDTVRELLNDPEVQRFPIFGICLGHQILSLAHGASTYKLKFGHRGINHPIMELATGRVSISSQNHGFAVEASSCGAVGLEISHQHLNDGTVAGIQSRGGMIAGMQFHPEASPGPHDTAVFFQGFADAVRVVFGESRC